MDIIRSFKSFLRKNEALEAFVANFKENYKKLVDYKVNDYLKEAHPYNYFTGAFPWEDSPEGGVYWMRLEDEWRELYDRLMLR